MMPRYLIIFTLPLVFVLLFASGRSFADAEISDPLESINRLTFSFNRGVEKILLRPTARVYRLLPLFARDRIRNVSIWLGKPVSAVNNLLQGDIEYAAADIMAFAFNGTIGIYGVFDFAGTVGVKTRKEDFGQTLGSYKIGSGTYIVLPALGPSNARDTVGIYSDYKIGTYLLEDALEKNNLNGSSTLLAVGILGMIDSYARYLDQIIALENSSLDYYSTLRSVYTQSREAEILNLEEEKEREGEDILSSEIDLLLEGIE